MPAGKTPKGPNKNLYLSLLYFPAACPWWLRYLVACLYAVEELFFHRRPAAGQGLFFFSKNLSSVELSISIRSPIFFWWYCHSKKK
jgi:hypothetical protein